MHLFESIHFKLYKRIYMKHLLLFILICTVLLSANQPHKLNFQGILTGPHGATVADSTYAFGFSIYDAEVAGNKLWEESKLLTTSHGIYQSTLGNDSTLNTLSFDKPYFVQVTVNSTVLPLRTKLTTVPYAISANNVTGHIAASATIAENLTVKSINGIQDNMSLQVDGSLTMTVDPIEKVITLNGIAPIQGIQGVQGLIGPQGPAGADGVTGTNGGIGPQGVKGETGHGLAIQTMCDSLFRVNPIQESLTCMDQNTKIIYYTKGNYSPYDTIGLMTTDPENVAHWNNAYTHILPENDSLHFSSTIAKQNAEQNADVTHTGLLSHTYFNSFLSAKDSISILAKQDTTFYNTLVGLDTDIYDSIGRATTLLSTSISQLSGSLDGMWQSPSASKVATNKLVGIGDPNPNTSLSIIHNVPGAALRIQRHIDSGNVFLGSGSSNWMIPLVGGLSEDTLAGLYLYTRPYEPTQTGFKNAAIYLNARAHNDASILTSGNILQVANNQNPKFTISHDGNVAYNDEVLPTDLHPNYHYIFQNGSLTFTHKTTKGREIWNCANTYYTERGTWKLIDQTLPGTIHGIILGKEYLSSIPFGSTEGNYLAAPYMKRFTDENGDISISGSITQKAKVFRARLRNDFTKAAIIWETVPFDSIPYNTLGGTFANNTFTAVDSGYYQISVTGYSTTAPVALGHRYAIGATINGVLDSFTGGNYSRISGDTPLAGYSAIVKLGHNSTLTIDAYSAIEAEWSGILPVANPGHEMIWDMHYLGN